MRFFMMMISKYKILEKVVVVVVVVVVKTLRFFLKLAEEYIVHTTHTYIYIDV